MRGLFASATVVAAAALSLPLETRAVEWAPIDEATLAITTPKIDPGADSEAIFRQIWIDDRVLGGE